MTARRAAFAPTLLAHFVGAYVVLKASALNDIACS